MTAFCVIDYFLRMFHNRAQSGYCILLKITGSTKYYFEYPITSAFHLPKIIYNTNALHKGKIDGFGPTGTTRRGLIYEGFSVSLSVNILKREDLPSDETNNSAS